MCDCAGPFGALGAGLGPALVPFLGKSGFQFGDFKLGLEDCAGPFTNAKSSIDLWGQPWCERFESQPLPHSPGSVTFWPRILIVAAG